MDMRKRVLFLCAENGCRSQMAEGLLRTIASDRFNAYSAGSMPAKLNANAVKVTAELGIDISHQSSKHVNEFTGQASDYVITVCDPMASDSCPSFTGPAVARLHWSFNDPATVIGSGEQLLEAFRGVRDQIKKKVEGSLATERVEASYRQ